MSWIVLAELAGSLVVSCCRAPGSLRDMGDGARGA